MTRAQRRQVKPPHKNPAEAEIELKTAGQRRINLIWESTQALIAIGITAAVIYSELKKIESTVLINAFFLVISVYLVRTNHSVVGGAGSKKLSETR